MDFDFTDDQVSLRDAVAALGREGLHASSAGTRSPRPAARTREVLRAKLGRAAA